MGTSEEELAGKGGKVVVVPEHEREWPGRDIAWLQVLRHYTGLPQGTPDQVAEVLDRCATTSLTARQGLIELRRQFLTPADRTQYLDFVAPWYVSGQTTWGAYSDVFPTRPGVYIFYALRPDVPRPALYVGESGDLRERLSGHLAYLDAEVQTGARAEGLVWPELISALGVGILICPTEPGARKALEDDLIDTLDPRYNRKRRPMFP